MFLLGYEVEIGFAPLGGGKDLLFPLDKDGLRTCAMFYEMADFVYSKHNKTLVEFLRDVLYPTYGFLFLIPFFQKFLKFFNFFFKKRLFFHEEQVFLHTYNTILGECNG